MANEPAPAAGEEEPLNTPAEEAPTDPSAEQPDGESDPVATLASEMGWVPKDQFRGDPEAWKPADEFIRAGKDINRNLSKELRGLKDTVGNMSRTSAALLEQQLAERDAYWQNQRREAIEAGDVQAVEYADQQRQQLRQQLPTTSTAPPTPEGQDFAQRHPWFGKDEEATRYAIGRADIYARQGLSPARQLAAVEKDMKDIFPDLFSPPAKQPPAVARPPSRSASTAGRGKSFHDLPAEAQAVARDMVERGVIPSTDLYVTNYFNDRRVG